MSTKFVHIPEFTSVTLYYQARSTHFSPAFFSLPHKLLVAYTISYSSTHHCHWSLPVVKSPTSWWGSSASLPLLLFPHSSAEHSSLSHLPPSAPTQQLLPIGCIILGVWFMGTESNINSYTKKLVSCAFTLVKPTATSGKFTENLFKCPTFCVYSDYNGLLTTLSTAWHFWKNFRMRIRTDSK